MLLVLLLPPAEEAPGGPPPTALRVARLTAHARITGQADTLLMWAAGPGTAATAGPPAGGSPVRTAAADTPARAVTAVSAAVTAADAPNSPAQAGVNQAAARAYAI